MKYFYLICIQLFLLSGCRTTTETTIGVIDRYYQSGRFNGCLLVAQYDSVLIDTALGYSDFIVQKVLNKTTPFYIASLTKPITALAITLLAQDGMLSMDDYAAKFVPDLPAYAQHVTIRQLLNHTSGIRDYENVLTKVGLTNGDVIRWLRAEDGLAFASGTKFQYSNSGYIVLALTIENVSKMPFVQFLKEHVFGPLQMQHSTVFQANTVITQRAIGHDRNKKVDDYSILTTGDGGIYSTVADLYKLDQALRESKLLSVQSTEQLYQTPILHDGKSSKYGLGWYVEHSDGVMIAQHTGGLAGFRSLFWRDLKNGYTIIALTNQGEAFPIFHLLEDIKKTLK